jgi:hypothetical protein
MLRPETVVPGFRRGATAVGAVPRRNDSGGCDFAVATYGL